MVKFIFNSFEINYDVIERIKCFRPDPVSESILPPELIISAVTPEISINIICKISDPHALHFNFHISHYIYNSFEKQSSLFQTISLLNNRKYLLPIMLLLSILFCFVVF